MIARLYYDCPIKAAYMSKYFEVKFWLSVVLINDNCENGIDIIPSIEATFKEMGRINVHLESEHIFEPQEGDKGVVKFPAENLIVTFFDTNWIGGHGKLALDYKPSIILRNNKQFFMPKIEEQNDI